MGAFLFIKPYGLTFSAMAALIAAVVFFTTAFRTGLFRLGFFAAFLYFFGAPVCESYTGHEHDGSSQ